MAGVETVRFEETVIRKREREAKEERLTAYKFLPTFIPTCIRPASSSASIATMAIESIVDRPALMMAAGAGVLFALQWDSCRVFSADVVSFQRPATSLYTGLLVRLSAKTKTAARAAAVLHTSAGRDMQGVSIKRRSKPMNLC